MVEKKTQEINQKRAEIREMIDCNLSFIQKIQHEEFTQQDEIRTANRIVRDNMIKELDDLVGEV
jgi:hypothetical protein